MQKKFLVVSIFIAALFSTVLMAGAAFAQQAPAQNGYGFMGQAGQGGRGQFPPGVFGKVTAIDGTTITITNSRTDATYTVDASNATVMKNGAKGSMASIAVGDMIMAQGTASGSSVAATAISDGFGARGNFSGMRMGSSTFNASGTRGRFGTFNRPSGTASGTLHFASGTFPGFHDFSSSTQSSTLGRGADNKSRPGFVNSVESSIKGFLKNIFSFFKR